MRVGIVGTFDVGNFGDLLFPHLAQHELAARLGELELVRYSYRDLTGEDWTYPVRAVQHLPGDLEDLDGLVVGGGHLVRFDTGVAAGYGPTSSHVAHPVGYWLTPTLLAAEAGVPVVWNAVGATEDLPAWAHPLLAVAMRAADRVTVRDHASAEALAAAAPDVEVVVTPDTGWGIPRLLPASDSDAFSRWRSAAGLEGQPYVVVQPSPRLGGVRAQIQRAVHAAREHGFAVVELPISPALGDRVGRLQLQGTVGVEPWPDPLVTAEIVRGARAVVAQSLHLSLTTLAHGVPLLRLDSQTAGKYRIAGGMSGVTFFTAEHDRLPKLLVEAAGDPADRSGRPVPTDVVERLEQLDAHWDALAATLRRPADPQRARETFRASLAALPGAVVELHERTVAAVERERATAQGLREDLRAARGQSDAPPDGGRGAAQRADALRRQLATRNEQLDQLRRQLHDAREAERQVDAWLRQLSTEVEKLLRSNRWRVGSRIGDLVERATPGSGPTKATERIDGIVGAHRRWREERTGQRAERSAGEEASVGGSAAADAARRQERYERFIAEVETTPPPRGASAPRVRAVLLASASSGTAAQRSLDVRSTVTSLTPGVDAVTVLHHRDDPDVARAAELAEVPATVLAVAGDVDEVVVRHLAEVGEDYVVFLLPGDRPAVTLADGIAEAAALHPAAAAIVLDSDVVGPDGLRREPRFGPRFCPDLELECDTVGRAAAFRREAVADVSVTADRSVVRRLLLALADAGEDVEKHDRVLVHHGPDRRSAGERAGHDAEVAREVLAGRGERAASVVERPWGVRVAYPPTGTPTVSIVVPFKDRADLLETCVRSILRVTTWEHYELLLVDNRSTEPETLDLLEELVDDPRVRVLRYDHEFNYSKLNNWAAAQARGDVLVFLNNDTKILTPDWLQRLAGWAQRPGVGLVGAKLHFADGRIQHAGVVVGVNGFAAHAFAGLQEPHVPHPEVRHVREWSAVTAACMATLKERFEEVGRFDETFLVTGNDVELGLRYRRHGYRNLVEPEVTAFHFERSTRSQIPTQRVDKLRSLETYQPELEHGDPYWNGQLSRWSAAMEPRVAAREDGYAELRAKVLAEEEPRREPRLLNVGEPGFLRRYDASVAELRANAEHVARFRADPRLELGTVTWFLPVFDHVYRGGIYTIVRFADHLTRTQGTHNRFVLIGKQHADVEEITRQVREAFPEVDAEVIHLGLDDDERDLPPADAGICTLWTSAYHLLRYQQCRGKFYLVQDHEPSFYAGNAIQGLVEQTYRFGFSGIANTAGVGDAYRAYGNPTLSFTPAVDRDVYYPPAEPRDDGVTRIVFYGRPANERNAFELGVQAFLVLKERWGDAVEIVSAGAEFDVGYYGLDGVVENLGVLPNTEAVADLYRRSDIGVVFMFSRHPSYQPFEYMATGTATVTNHNEANGWLYHQRENVLLSPPTVTAVADAIGELVEDRTLRQRIVDGGLETVAGLDWQRELERVRRFLATGEGADG